MKARKTFREIGKSILIYTCYLVVYGAGMCLSGLVVGCIFEAFRACFYNNFHLVRGGRGLYDLLAAPVGLFCLATLALLIGKKLGRIEGEGSRGQYYYKSDDEDDM